jgi:hypothetical protein
MAYAHGLTVQIGGVVGTQMRLGGSAVPVFFGCAHGVGATAGVADSVPHLISNLAEYVATFGWGNLDGDDEPDLSGVDHDYTLDEVAWVLFKLNGVGPAVFINIYNSTDFVGGVSTVVGGDFTASLPLVETAIVDLGIIPSHVLVPRYSQVAALKTAMAALGPYNGVPVMKIVDMEDDPADDDAAAKAAAVIEGAALTHENMLGCWPEFGGFPLSTIAMATALWQDVYRADGIPLHTPSNKLIRGGITRVTDERVVLSSWLDDLNEVGIMSIKTLGSRSRLYGSQMFSYDASGDADYVNDSYIPRRLTNYIFERIMSDVDEYVDDPLNTRLIEDVLAKLNQFGTGLVGRGAMLGFNASFFAEKNPVAELAAGKITLTVTLLPAREASNIVIDLIIDLNLFGTL